MFIPYRPRGFSKWQTCPCCGGCGYRFTTASGSDAYKYLCGKCRGKGYVLRAWAASPSGGDCTGKEVQ